MEWQYDLDEEEQQAAAILAGMSMSPGVHPQDAPQPNPSYAHNATQPGAAFEQYPPLSAGTVARSAVGYPGMQPFSTANPSEEERAAALAWVGGEYARRDALQAQQGGAEHRYQESTGRFGDPAQGPRRLGLPRPDLTNPGGYQFISRETQPEAFRTPIEQAEANRTLRDWQTARQESTRGRSQAKQPSRRGRRGSGKSRSSNRPAAAAAPAPGPRATSGSSGLSTLQSSLNPAAPEFKLSPELSHVIAKQDRDERMKRRTLRGLLASDKSAEVDQQDDQVEGEEESDGEAEAQDEEEEAAAAADSGPWKVGQTHAHPLTYEVPANTPSGKKTKKINFVVDFSDSKSVSKATKARNLAIWRANKALGIGQPRRPSTVGREYSQANDDFIVQTHHDYAANNGGRRVPMPELVQQYNQQFPLEHRTSASISSHIDKRTPLKAKRASYAK